MADYISVTEFAEKFSMDRSNVLISSGSGCYVFCHNCFD